MGYQLPEAHRIVYHNDLSLGERYKPDFTSWTIACIARLQLDRLSVAFECGLDQGKVFQNLLGLSDLLVFTLPSLGSGAGDAANEARQLTFDTGSRENLLNDALAVLEDAELRFAAIRWSESQVALLAPGLKIVTKRLASRRGPALAEGAEDA